MGKEGKMYKANDIYVVFQPIVDLQELQTIGYEVLLRGKQPPEELFNKAKTSDDIINLDQQARSIALKESLVEDEMLFINCHPLTVLYDDKLTYDLSLYPQRKQIIIEITEQHIDNLNLFKKRIKNLKELGVKIAIDDFGSGFANLQMIEHMEPDYIKLDKSLSRNVHATPKSRLIISQLVNIFSALNVHLIVEGIENKQQFEILVSCGVKLGQGYYFGKPGLKKNELILK